MSHPSIKALHYIGYVEGTSFLILLGIAMPLKYFADMPQMVSIVGMAHGVLFIMYAVAAFWAFFANQITLKQLGGAALASILPFGPFVFDAKLRRAAEAKSTSEMPNLNDTTSPKPTR